MKKTIFVTFYSYKGGVGRTLALVNIAYQLAQEGKRIVLVDFDLEAPGLHKFPFCTKKIKKGLMDYIFDYVNKKSIPDIKDYLYYPKKDVFKNLILLPAGACDEEYRKNLVKLDWDIIYEHYYGFDFFENMKEDIVKTCDTPDYVFIDSRTGITDTGYICTRQLPDIVVLLFSLNNQNRDGIEKIYHIIKTFKHPEIPDKKINVIPVASPVPYGEEALKRDCIEDFSKIFKEGEKIFVLPYHPRLAFTETLIFDTDMKYEDIGKRISELTIILKKLNPLDIDQYSNELLEYFTTGQFEKAISIQKNIAEIKENDPLEWYLLGTVSMYFKAEESLKYFDKAIELDPNNPDFYSNKGYTLVSLQRFEEAINLYDKALAINPNHANSCYNKACALSMLGREEEAIEYLQKAIEIDPSFKEKAKVEKDFTPLQNLESFKKLVGIL